MHPISTSMPFSIAQASRSCASERIIQRRHDQQDVIGAKGARLGNLQRINHEILAQNRQRNGIARGNQIFGRALEPRAIGHTDRQVAPPSS